MHFAVLVGYMYHSLQLFREQKVLKRVAVGKKIVKKCNFRKDSEANIKFFLDLFSGAPLEVEKL